MYVTRRLVLAACRNRKALPAISRHMNTKALEQIKGDVNVGRRDQFAHHFNMNIEGRDQRQRHQQGG